MQEIVVILVIVAAVSYLFRRFVLTAQNKKKKGCEKCGLNDKKTTV